MLFPKHTVRPETPSEEALTPEPDDEDADGEEDMELTMDVNGDRVSIITSYQCKLKSEQGLSAKPTVSTMSEGEAERTGSEDGAPDGAFEYEDGEGMEDEDEAMEEDDEDYDDPSFGAKRKKTGGKVRVSKERGDNGGFIKKKKCRWSYPLSDLELIEGSYRRLSRSTREVGLFGRGLRGQVA